MNKILFIFILSMFCASGVSASEIFGQISTDPKNLSIDANNPPAAPLSVEKPVSSGSGLIFQNQKQVAAEKLSKTDDSVSYIKNVQVLGLSRYPDGSLLRGIDKKIYLIRGQVRRYISSLKELSKYRGQTVYNVAETELSQYQEKHFDNELVREKGTAKVYAIKQGDKQHILNLEELRAHFFGLEIFNISYEEMSLY